MRTALTPSKFQTTKSDRKNKHNGANCTKTFHTTPYSLLSPPTVIQLFALQEQLKLALNKNPNPILPGVWRQKASHVHCIH